MKTVGRIIIISGLLVGGSFLFRLWALQEFNFTLDTMLASVAKSNIVPVTDRASSPAVVTSIVSTTMSSSTQATSSPIFNGLHFVFPTSQNQLYQGCSYTVTWQSSSTIETMNISLVDAGTLKTAGPVAGGLPGTTTVGLDQNFPWKIGNVWPGRYYVLISSVNGTTTKIRSSQFKIDALPNDILKSGREDFCKSEEGKVATQ